MRLLFYSRENIDLLEIMRKSCGNALSCETTLAEVYIDNNDLEKFKITVKRIAVCLRSSPQKTEFYRRNISRLFSASKRHGRSYNFRLHLVKTFIEHRLFRTSIIDNFHCQRLNIDIPVAAPTILLELCYEARSVSLEEFDRAFEVCVSGCTVAENDRPIYLKDEVQSDYIEYIPSRAYVRRLFALALDNHVEQIYPDFDWTSSYNYHLRKGSFVDLSDQIRSQLQFL